MTASCPQVFEKTREQCLLTMNTFIKALWLLLTICLARTLHGCGTDPLNGACGCTNADNPDSGDVNVGGARGCGNHLGDSCFCYIRDPQNCKRNDVTYVTPSQTFPQLKICLQEAGFRCIHRRCVAGLSAWLNIETFFDLHVGFESVHDDNNNIFQGLFQQFFSLTRWP